ncbi:MAG: ABC transporter ATP-binding protein [Saprospiraceae bacterium]|nr:ABC transporter ATP-binding protein [Saprospiraceae bacterium]
MKLLEVKNLNVQFKQANQIVDAVRNVTFDVYAGETLGIVGESGSGKTVTAMSILNLLGPTAIREAEFIRFENKDLLLYTESEFQSIRLAQISIIFQEPMSSLNPGLTCGYQVIEGYLAHVKVSKKEAKRIVLDLFTRLGLGDVNRIYSSYPHELSGGQLQRVLIALALVCKPKLVIADEPTTALDVTVQRMIIELLKDLKKEFGLTLIFISHDLGLIKNICDRVIVMRKGEIVEVDSVNNIFLSASHPYTKGLIYSRAPMDKKLKRLPTVEDFTERNLSIDSFISDFNTFQNSECDRRIHELSAKQPLLEVEHLTVAYTKEKTWWGGIKSYFNAVDNISFLQYPGEVIGIVGESGSGKSSLGKAILGLTPKYSGKLEFKGKDISDLSFHDWRPLRKKMQIIFQDPYSALNPRLSIGKAIVEPMLVHKLYSTAQECKEKAIELLEEVGLQADHFDRYPHQFSGGQRQRICIARAIGLQPEFIICDESVSALDVSVQAQVLNLFQELKEKFKLSYFFISHDLSVINFIADRIFVMKQGRIIEEGKSYEIIHNPKEIYTQELVTSIYH